MMKYFWLVALWFVSLAAVAQSSGGDPYTATAMSSSTDPYVANPSLANTNVCTDTTSSSTAATAYTISDATANALMVNLCTSNNQGYTNLQLMAQATSATASSNASALALGYS